MRKDMLIACLLALPFLIQLYGYNNAIAETPIASFLDTGAQKVEEMDATSVWPEKIVVDSKANIIMMVWFDLEKPRQTQIPFKSVKYLKIVPRYERNRPELHIALNDGRIFLGASETDNVTQPAQLLSAVLGKKLKKGNVSDMRIISVELQDRSGPKIVLGNYDSPDALKPLSKRVAFDSESDRSALGETVGELNEKSKGITSKNDVNSVIKRSMGRFRNCYQKSLKKNQNLSGEIIIRFGIGTDGKVTGAKVQETSMKSSEVERCILKHFYGLRFAPPAGGSALINYPLSFSNQGFE